MGELDDAVALRATGEGTFEIHVSDGWGIAGIPNGATSRTSARRRSRRSSRTPTR